MSMQLELNEENKKPLILIVDDIPKNLQVLSNILNIEGYQISFASNGKQALSILETTIPDIILLDIMMPEMDGFEVCKLIKSNSFTQNIPIIFLTGKADTDDIVKGLKLGAVDYITKPFNSAELLSRIRTHIELKFSRDAIVKYNERLLQAQEELRQLNASKDKFFSIIAHDLRGPFSGFLGLSELLAEEYKELEPVEISQIAESMNKAAKRLFSFLENLLEWSRTQMGRMEYNPTKLDIFETAIRIIGLFTANADEKGISLESKIEKNTFVVADNNMLNTIVRNLVSNALKFTHSGGKITISADEISDNEIMISVSDTGIGIKAEDIQKIFKIDSKFTTPGTSNEQGTGLGLILCKEFVEKHGGELFIESAVGKGTKFYFNLKKD